MRRSGDSVESRVAVPRSLNEERCLAIRIATANVNTLSSGKFADNVTVSSGRAQLLEMSFDCAGFDCIGIQEGRVTHDQRKSGIIYEMLIAGCTPSGLYGVQIWVRRSPQTLIQAWMAHSPRILETNFSRHASEANGTLHLCTRSTRA